MTSTLDAVQIRYAKAMFAAQRFEGRVRGLMVLRRVMNSLWGELAPPSDVEFESLLAPTRFETLGTMVNELLRFLDTFGTPFPAIAQDALRTTVQMRNFLAHGFVESNHLLFAHGEALGLLSEQLVWWEEVFETWLPYLDKLADMVATALGVSMEERSALESQYLAQLPEVRQEVLDRLRTQVGLISASATLAPRAP